MESLKKTSPLCFLPSGRLVCYKSGNLLLVERGRVLGKYVLFRSKKERVLGRCNALYRLLRLGIRAAVAMDENRILLSIGNMVYEYDFSKEKLSDGYHVGAGIRPLIFTKVENIKGFDDCVVFGGYLGNGNKTPVDIYRRIDTDRWETVYTFAQGAINHVHNIVADPYRQCLWAFTGDFDEASAIWKITDNFQKVERVACNNQQYRGCVVFPLQAGLLYATDAPFAKNFIYLMNPETLELKRILPIAGSCIYGCQCGGKMVFSSSVEPDGRNSTRWNLLFSRKRGEGITDMYVHLYCGNLEKGFKEIYKEKKDLLPYLFQFGVFKFPYGKSDSDRLYFQPVATNKNDLRLMELDLADEMV